jgi:muramidase (phage lysozyme)
MEETGVGIKDPLFFIGVVENNVDPRLEGRVQVRAFGVHGTVQQVPTEYLPWATLIYGSYDPNSPIPPLNSWVFGFFIDGRDAQQPMILGLIPTQATELIEPERTGWGVIHPRNHDRLAQGSRAVDYGQPSRSRLARGENIEETYVLAQESLRVVNIPSANGAPSWGEPPTAYNAQYPFNRVIETAAGHSIELDDTPGAERIMIYHRSGSYIQIDTRGTTVQRSQSDRYDITSTNAHIYVGGRSLVTINGDSYVRVNGNKTEEIIGDYIQIVRGNHMISVGGQLNLNAGDEVQARGAKVRLEANVEGINVKSAKNINIQSDMSIHSKAGISIFIDASDSANIKAGNNIFAQAGAAFNAKSETMYLNSSGALDLKGGHVKLGGGTKVSINASIVAIDDIVQLASGQAMAPQGAADASEAEGAQSAEMPEPAERSTSATRHTNRSSMGSVGYASTDDGQQQGGSGGEGNQTNGRYRIDPQTGIISAAVTQGAIRPLLDLIARAEGAGYDTVYGGYRIRPEKPITTMTISELMDWQYRNVQAGAYSSAAGRYQAMRATIKDVVDSGVLSLNDIFSPETQDKFAINRLVYRGINSFLNGSLSIENFGNNLSMEWAALPVVVDIYRREGNRLVLIRRAGYSYYASDGVNKSRVQIDEVLTVLRELKEAVDSGQGLVNQNETTPYRGPQ